MAIEAPNTLQSKARARVILAYGEGLCGGLRNGDKSVFLNETQLQANDDSYNFKNVTVVERTGTSGQLVVPGFEETSNVVDVSLAVEQATPVIKTVVNSSVDAVRIIIGLPRLVKINSTNGNQNGTSVQVKFEVRDPASGVWENRGTKTIKGKTTTPFQKHYRVEGPDTITAAWDIRVTRITADSSSNFLANATQWNNYAEIFDSQETYPNTAYVALDIDLTQFGGVLPKIALDVDGTLVGIPNNYDQTDMDAPFYTGVWNGTFVEAATPNPIWHERQLIIEGRYGLDIDESFIDKFEFYDIAQYNDAVDSSTGNFVGVDAKEAATATATISGGAITGFTVTGGGIDYSSPPAVTITGDGTGASGTAVLTGDIVSSITLGAGGSGYTTATVVMPASALRRRFTFNTQITRQENGLTMLQAIMSSSRGMLYYGVGQAVPIQDSPKTVSLIANNENVEEGKFIYSSTEAKDRITICSVQYNDKDNFYRIDNEVYPPFDDHATDPGIARFGKNQVNITKYGCNNRAEALAFAKWVVISSQTETQTVSFTGGPDWVDAQPGQLIHVYDKNYAGTRLGGRLATGSTTSTINIDSPITIESGETYTLTLIDIDGKTPETQTITNGVGDHTAITVASPFANTPTDNFIWAITASNIEPRPFRVINNTASKKGLSYEILGFFYNEAKFDLVEKGIIVPEPTFSRFDLLNVDPPTNFSFVTNDIIDPFDARIDLTVSWDPPAAFAAFVTGYRVWYSFDFGQQVFAGLTNINEITIKDAQFGTYRFSISAITVIDSESVQAESEITISIGGVSSLGAPIDFEHLISWDPHVTSGSDFSGLDGQHSDLVLNWDDDPADASLTGTFRKWWTLEFFDITDVVGTDDPFRSFTITEPTLRDGTKFTGPQLIVAKSLNYGFFVNAKDSKPNKPRRQIVVSIRAIDAQGRLSARNTVTFTDTAPAAPTITSITNDSATGFSIIHTGLTVEEDVIGIQVWASDTPGFTPGPDNSLSFFFLEQVTQGAINFPRLPFPQITAGTEYFFRTAKVDGIREWIKTTFIQASINPDLVNIGAEFAFTPGGELDGAVISDISIATASIEDDAITTTKITANAVTDLILVENEGLFTVIDDSATEIVLSTEITGDGFEYLINMDALQVDPAVTISTSEQVTGFVRIFKLNATNSSVILNQTEAEYDNSPSTEGIFDAGTGHAASDEITLRDGSVVTVDAVSGGLVTEFTITTISVGTDWFGLVVRKQVSTTGSGIDFSLTPLEDNYFDYDNREYSETILKMYEMRNFSDGDLTEWRSRNQFFFTQTLVDGDRYHFIIGASKNLSGSPTLELQFINRFISLLKIKR